MKLSYHFNLASLSTRELHSLLCELFNALAAVNSAAVAQNLSAAIVRVRREIAVRASLGV